MFCVIRNQPARYRVHNSPPFVHTLSHKTSSGAPFIFILRQILLNVHPGLRHSPLKPCFKLSFPLKWYVPYLSNPLSFHRRYNTWCNYIITYRKPARCTNFSSSMSPLSQITFLSTYFLIPSVYIFFFGGTRWRSWLRHCATSRQVASLIPDGIIGIFQ
jgi:hypothetical protein